MSGNGFNPDLSNAFGTQQPMMNPYYDTGMPAMGGGFGMPGAGVYGNHRMMTGGMGGFGGMSGMNEMNGMGGGMGGMGGFGGGAFATGNPGMMNGNGFGMSGPGFNEGGFATSSQHQNTAAKPTPFDMF